MRSGVLLTAGCLILAGQGGPQAPVGLSLFFQNGTMPAIQLVGDHPRFAQEMDIVATSLPSKVDRGIDPVKESGDLADLDWSGVELVDELWRPNVDGTFMRQRFYRNATWMKRPSTFLITPVDVRGVPTGNPMAIDAGDDEDRHLSDDGWVRRFVARQYGGPCKTKGDCTGATFTAQALVQWRIALNQAKVARPLPPSTRQLRLYWSEQPQRTRQVDVRWESADKIAYGYGLDPHLEVVSRPKNGLYFQPGDEVTVRMTLLDSAGRRLHPPGSLPSYGQFLRGEIASGLQYFNFTRTSQTYYALKHRDGTMMIGLTGPLDRIKQTRTVMSGARTPTSMTASVDNDGFVGMSAAKPDYATVFGGPNDKERQLSDTHTFKLPADAPPGTYVIGMKARRVWGGEAIQRGTTIDIQVGQAEPSNFTWKVNCTGCHNGPSVLANLNHGISDLRVCQACHAQQPTEPDSPIDWRVHLIHSRSKRFDAEVGQCSNCHVVQPRGEQRGVPLPLNQN